VAVREAYRQNIAPNPSETEMAQFILTVRDVFGDHSVRISEGILGKFKRHPMLLLVLTVLLGIPFESCLYHGERISADETDGNTIIWLIILLSQRGRRISPPTEKASLLRHHTTRVGIGAD